MLHIYAPVITPRLTYILEVIMGALGTAYHLTDTYNEDCKPWIEYSSEPKAEAAYRIAAHQLLRENTITKQPTPVFTWEGLPVFFGTHGGDLPFDLLAASFYLVSRYEEYLHYEPDMYGRYPHTNSVAWRTGFLDTPLVNYWIEQFKIALQKRFPTLAFEPRLFQFIPTYDIDIAWAYLGKGIVRNSGAALKSIVSGRGGQIRERLRVLQGKQRDPFDIFEELQTLHSAHTLAARYFVLLATRKHTYDRNVSPNNNQFRVLVQALAATHHTGLHPSWQSGDDIELLKTEKQSLEQLLNEPVNSSRQHYIRFTLPDTYRHLLANGFTEDYSMGYGSINGFRSSFCLPHYWYDLQREETTRLLLHPFCWMEANSFFEQSLSLAKAAEELQHYFDVCRQVNGHLITICHNHLLGNKQLFPGWLEMYFDSVKKNIPV